VASKRHLRRRACEGKIKYLSVKEAYKIALQMNHRIYHERLSVYKCEHCNLFHLGRTPIKVSKFIKSKRGIR